MTDLARLYAQIALLRRGPQDVPASMLLLAITVLAYCIVNLSLTWLLPALNGPWAAMLLVEVLFTLAWYAALLRAVRRRERTVQTITAVFGYRAVLAPLSIVAEWLVRHFSQDELWQFPIFVLYTAVLVWVIAANIHILRAALEWSLLSCIALVILEILTGQLVLFALVPAAR